MLNSSPSTIVTTPTLQTTISFSTSDGDTWRGQSDGDACVEDLRHFVLECPAYGHVRVRYSAVFGTAPALGTDVHAIFDCDCQDQLAHALYTMTKFREHCLSRPQGSVVNVGMMQMIVDDDEELSRVQ